MSRICLKHLTWDCKLCNPAPATTPQGNTGTVPAAPPSSLGALQTTTATTAGSPANSSVVAPPLSVGLSSQVATTTSVIPLGPTGTSQPGKRMRTFGPRKPPKKRIKKTIIDDEVACQIFRELRVNSDFLNSGKLLAWALQPDNEAFYSIHEYIANSQEHGFGVKILSILQVMVKADSMGDGPLDFNEDPKAQGKQRLMLWHGTRAPAVCSILQNGLRLPALHGQMFGAGIYFADRVSKSCQYTDRYVGGHAYLFLCDVLVGKTYSLGIPMTGISAPPYIPFLGPYDSVKGCGANVPDPAADKVIDGCVWPMGKTVRRAGGAGLYLHFNEYIVYKCEQVQPKYLVKVEFTAQPHYENLK